MKTRIFLDMDGTLCQWKPFVETIEEIYQEGWFLHMTPQQTVIDAAKLLVKQKNHTEVFVLTAVPDSPFAILEKNQWLDKHLPEVDEQHRLFVNFKTGKKSQCAPGGIRETDVLLDDYTVNLWEWSEAGGTAIKLYNGINGSNGTWKGRSCRVEDTPAEIAAACRMHEMPEEATSDTLFCIVGPSGSGKTTVVEMLEKEYGYTSVASYTDRPPRYEGETGHTFVTQEEFDQLGEFCAYTEFDGHRYGTTAEQLKDCDLYVIDPAGVEYLKEHPIGKNVKVIGLTADNDTLYDRMALRGDSKKKILARIMHDANVFHDLHYISDIVFDVRHMTVQELTRAIRAIIADDQSDKINKGRNKFDENKYEH